MTLTENQDGQKCCPGCGRLAVGMENGTTAAGRPVVKCPDCGYWGWVR